MSESYTLPLSLLRDQVDYVDLNSMIGNPGESDLLYDKQAIHQAILNIFRTTPGEAGPIFEPEFGSLLYNLLFEPMDDVTSTKIRAATFQALQRWEPRIDVDFSSSTFEANDAFSRYDVSIQYRIRSSGRIGTSVVSLPKL